MRLPGIRLLATVALVAAMACGCIRADMASPAATTALELTVGSAAGAAPAFAPGRLRAPAGAHGRTTCRHDSTQPPGLTFQAPISIATMTIVEPGMSDAVDLLTPGPGTYPFVCTIHVGMSGTLTIS